MVIGNVGTHPGDPAQRILEQTTPAAQTFLAQAPTQSDRHIILILTSARELLACSFRLYFSNVSFLFADKVSE